MSRGFNFKGTTTNKVIPITKPTLALAPVISPDQITFDQLPDSALLREAQLVRSSKNMDSARAILPFSGSTLWRLVRLGKFPKPRKLSDRVTVWQAGDIRSWITAQQAA